MGYILGGLLVALLVILATNILELLKTLLWRPYVLTKHFENQGISGPPYHLLYGCLDEMKKLGREAKHMLLDNHSNDITPKIMPHYHKWFSKYGDTILYWYGVQPRITVMDPEIAKQILSNKFGFFVKSTYRPSIVIGKGLVLLDGPVWARRRRVLNPAFSMDKLKAMINRMTSCTLEMAAEWEEQAAASKDGSSSEIRINSAFQKLTADIISHTSFGSSYLQGIQAFKALTHLQSRSAAILTNVFIPGTQYLPTRSNLEIWKLDRELNTSLRSIIENRLRSNSGKHGGGYGDDLLGIMIEASEMADAGTKSILTTKLKMKEIMDECRTFFFAGHETTSNLLTWAIFLITTHHEWQQRLREEVVRECGMNIPDADSLPKLKLMNMVLLETLRLYSPAIEVVRMATVDMKLGKLDIPKGTSLSIPIIMIHRSKELWGEDSNEFKPMRFENGVSMAAKHPNAFLSFGMGPRVCIGQNFAMMEAKSVLALLLQRFSFTLSPEYKHAPANNLTLQPQYGLPVIVKPLQT
ncbi:Cytochrome P450 709B2 [Linum perenne]